VRPTLGTHTAAKMGSSSGQTELEVVASGQRGSFPINYVWRLDSLEVLLTLRALHRRGIAELRSSRPGSLLATVGLDNRNSLGIYDWQMARLLASAIIT
jgi:hypothetical protein